MKFGVITFSYANTSHCEQSVRETGLFSVNLGDFMQTLAVRRLYQSLGIPDDQIVDIDRDSIRAYKGDPVAVVMSAVFYPWSFPLPENIVPVFVGFRASEGIIKNHVKYFRRFAPIGCRDTDTTEAFRKLGVDAYTSGCVTLTFEPRSIAPQEPCVLLVGGSGAGALPAEAIASMPTALREKSEFVFQRAPFFEYPLSAGGMKNAERYANFLLEDYRSRATLVVTSLHHATTPCISSGIPVVVCRNDENTRFSYMREFMDVYTPSRFAEINWNSVRVPDIRKIRDHLIENIRNGLKAASSGLEVH